MKAEKQQNISAAELSSFCGQVALIIESGLPLFEGMETLAETDKKSANAGMFRSASEGVGQTGTLYGALKDDGRWPDYLVEMVGIGERSGRLDVVMRGLEQYYAREDRIRSSLTSALTYPISLGVMLMLIVLIMLWRVLPIFRRTLASMGIGMGTTGSALMQVGSVLGWLVLILVGAGLIALTAVLILMKTPGREKTLETISSFLPPIRRLRNKITASRVISVLSLTLFEGFTTHESLEMTARALDDPKAREKIRQLQEQMDEGKTYADALEETGFFQELELRMIRMGMATGRVDQVLGKIAVLYEEQVESEISRAISIVEPTLVALLSVVVGAVLLSVMLPMAGILSSL